MIRRCVIDVGNTSIASAFVYNDEIITPLREPTSAYTTIAQLSQLISDVHGRSGRQSDEIVACVGVAHLRELMDDYAGSSETPVSFVSGSNLCGAHISYETPNTLGPDRIVNSIAVTHAYKQPTLVIDCGTAITIDLIDGNGVFDGGMIAPGVQTSLNALTHFAPSLPDVELVAPRNLIASNTVECIQSGVVYGAAAMIDSVIDRVKKFNPNIEVVITGGHSNLLAPLLTSSVTHDEWLTLRGLGYAETGNTS